MRHPLGLQVIELLRLINRKLTTMNVWDLSIEVLTV